MTQPAVLKRRAAERAHMLQRARDYVAALPGDIRVAVVYGSVARGDFNLWSDIDLLLVADRAPDRWLDRLDMIPPPPALVQPVVWTVHEWIQQLRRSNPIARESVECGVWLRGSPALLRTARE